MDKPKSFSKRITHLIKDDEGFSLLELVVAVGILLVLSIGGLVAYSSMINNARDAQASNIAADLYMLASTHRSAGEGFDKDAEELRKWAVQSNMSYERHQEGACEIYRHHMEGEYLNIDFTTDQSGDIKVVVRNIANGNTVERTEQSFNGTCS